MADDVRRRCGTTPQERGVRAVTRAGFIGHASSKGQVRDDPHLERTVATTHGARSWQSAGESASET
jgi:hypothetical protein